MSLQAPRNLIATLSQLPPGPVVVILNEDELALAATVDHHRALGFDNILVLGESRQATEIKAKFLPADSNQSLSEMVNPMIDHLAGRWVLMVHNAEFLYFPFCENRSIKDVTQFMTEERRDAVFCTTVDLYMPELDREGEKFDRDMLYFDRGGYYSTGRFDGPDRLERQFDLFGGLKWRFAEHVPWHRQSIDRIALFRAKTGLRIESNGRMSDPEMNTISCPWHNNLTAAIASYRVAKSLLRNPGSTFEIDGFMWQQSERFNWSSQQLMAHGLMEPGQWF